MRVIVSHVLSTIMNVDQVFVMRNGKLAKQGTCDELVIRTGGMFKDMWERRNRKKDDDNGEDDEYDRSQQLARADADSHQPRLGCTMCY